MLIVFIALFDTGNLFITGSHQAGIKAAGGIASLDDAYRFIELGATRLGTSRIVKLVKNEEATGY